MSERCEHCGCDKIYSGPPDCPRCGAPVCCEVCCKEDAHLNRIAELEAKLARVKRQNDTLHSFCETVINAYPDFTDEYEALNQQEVSDG